MSSLSRIGTKDGASIWAGALPKGRHGVSISALGIETMSPSRTGCHCQNRRRWKMLKPSDLTKAELLQVVEMLAMETGPYYLDRALGRIRLQRNDAHHERCVKLIDEEQKHYAAYFDLLRPYEEKPIADVPPDVLEQAQAELDKARAAGQEWNRRNGIKLKGRVSDEKVHR
nr:MAG TPA: Heterocyst differentiation control protein [Caudoviricetes sp.]